MKPKLFCFVFLWTVAVLGTFSFAGDDPPPDQPASTEDKPPEKKAWRQLKPDRLIADNSLIYISTPDLIRTKNAFNRTAFRALLMEDEVLQPISATFNKFKDTFVKGDGTRSELEVRRRNDDVSLLQKIAPYLDGQIAVAIEPGMDGFMPRFLLVASMPPGEAGDERQRVLNEILDRHSYMQTTDPRFRDFDDKVGTYDIHRIENADLGLNETWAFVENLFVYGRGKKIVENAINRYSAQNGAGTLALHNGYLNSYKEVGRDERGDALVYIQVDATSILGNLANQLPPGFQKLLGGAGGDAMRPQLAIGMQVGEGENASIREKILIRTPKDAMKGVEPCRAVTARFAGGDTLFFSAGTANMKDECKQMLEALASAAKAQGRESALSAQLRAAFPGVQTDDEVATKLDLFKGEMSAMVSYVQKANLKFEAATDLLQCFSTVFAVELDRDNAVGEAAFRALMQNIENATAQNYLTTIYRVGTVDTQIHYQKGAMPKEEKSGQAPLGFFPNIFSATESKTLPFFTAYARYDLEGEGGAQPRKFVLFSDSVEALKKALNQAQAARTALADSTKFKGLVKSFRESMYQVNYVDLNRVIDVYTTVLPMMSKAGIFTREQMAELPSPNVLNQHLFPMGWARSLLNEPEGILTEFSSPTGNLTLIGLVVSVAYPAINEKQKKAVSDEVDDKFKHISLALQLYAADFDRFPLQLSDLHSVYDKNDMHIFESPFKRKSVNNPSDIDNPELTNVVYVPSKSLQDLGKDILLYEKEPTKLVRSQDGSKLLYHVLQVDGKISFLPKVTLERRLGGKTDLGGAGPVEAVAPTTDKKEKN
jgi:hypothetical protein